MPQCVVDRGEADNRCVSAAVVDALPGLATHVKVARADGMAEVARPNDERSPVGTTGS